jgi:branched-chain amino acid transport system ATP-binding protein
LLEVKGLSAFYGDVQVLHDVTLSVSRNEIVAIVGANGAGKTTLLSTISGLIAHTRGSISFDGAPILSRPAHAIVDLGIAHVMEGRQVFPFMTVLENLEMGAYSGRARPQRAATLTEVYALFPILHDRRRQLAGSLSGGEQQMLAIGRALMGRPSLVLCDELSLGLSPLMVQKCFEIVQEIHRRGTTIVLVEQNVYHSLKLCHRAYVLENGRVVLEGSGEDLLRNTRLKQAYMGL